MPELAFFVLASLGNIYISRRALVAPRNHGFYRFWAWEALLGLLTLNGRYWGVDPTSPRQIISWVLLVASLYLVIQGTALLRRRGQATAARADASLYAFEKTTALVTTGLYGYIRHPLYSSLLFLGWGIFFKQPSWPAALLALVAGGLLVAAARVEEAENLRYFGAAYRDYMARSQMFLPFVL